MAIRVTNSSLRENTIININNNLRTLQEIQKQLTTGRRINRPSDDPVGIISTIRLRNSIEETNQHQTNLEDGRSRLNATYQALSNIEDLILEIQGMGSDALSSSQSATYSIVGQEIDGLLNEVFINANAKFLGKYLFGGHESVRAPYIESFDSSGNVISVARNRLLNGTDEIKGIDDPIYHAVGEGLEVQINISGSLPFMPNGEGGANDVFNTIINLRNAVLSGDLNTIKTSLDELEAEYENIINTTTVVGGRIQRLDSISQDNEEFSIFKEASLSEILNVDHVRAISDLNYQQFILENSLQVGARIIPLSLLDFI